MTRHLPEGAFGARDTVPRHERRPVAQVCPVPSRWVLDALAGECVEGALLAAEAELAQAWLALDEGACTGEALDRYIMALTERNALRDGRP